MPQNADGPENWICDVNFSFKTFLCVAYPLWISRFLSWGVPSDFYRRLPHSVGSNQSISTGKLKRNWYKVEHVNGLLLKKNWYKVAKLNQSISLLLLLSKNMGCGYIRKKYDTRVYCLEPKSRHVADSLSTMVKSQNNPRKFEKYLKYIVLTHPKSYKITSYLAGPLILIFLTRWKRNFMIKDVMNLILLPSHWKCHTFDFDIF